MSKEFIPMFQEFGKEINDEYRERVVDMLATYFEEDEFLVDWEIREIEKYNEYENGIDPVYAFICGLLEYIEHDFNL